MKKLTACRWLYALFLLSVLIVFGVQLRQGGWLQTELQALLPESHWSAAQQQADRHQEAQLNRQFIALVGHSEAQSAFQLTAELGEKWQKSGHFSVVNWRIEPNLPTLRQQLQQLRVATLPETVRAELLSQPNRYFQAYAEQLANPFQQQNLLPLNQDWLGFGRFALSAAQGLSSLKWHSENGMLYQESDAPNEKMTWVAIHAELAQADLISPSLALLNLVEESKQQIQAQHGKLLATGTSLFAAYAKQQAETESVLMSSLGIGFTLLLLLGVFRSLRVLWLFLPIAVGMLCGITATVLGFGHIHILTLVIGTSLIGVLIDFPLHWLSGALSNPNWQPQQAMNRLRFSFLISLLVTLLGYLLLGFTPLTVLKQTALFSAVALMTAMLATVLFLPKLFTKYRKGGFYTRPLFRYFRADIKPAPTLKIVGFIMVGFFLILGISKTHWQDDIRHWVALPENLLADAQQISRITQTDLGSQYFLVTAENDDNLLNKEQNLTQQLLLLQQQGKIHSFQALSQWIMSPQQQKAFTQQLARQIQPEDYAVLSEIGIEPAHIQQAIEAFAQEKPISLKSALQTELGQAWRSLYLGELAQGQVASMVKISGLQNVAEMTPLANGVDIFWQDKRAYLNQAFEQSRNQAAWLKVVSFGLAGLLLGYFFGLRHTARMLLVPFGAILASMALFGWLGLPISLFAMFGLLLVSAISIDYTAYMQTAEEPLAAKRIAVLLAATTTLISFLLLSQSHTPAVASFGLSVSLGIVFSVIFTFKIFN
ncbi:MMPL family transporter [Bibersteinia trehalosi]|uniref:MMPL family transporter n=1 Tax=Bibersteinia trehalosi TaxID=47735 RepID=UPI0040454E04